MNFSKIPHGAAVALMVLGCSGEKVDIGDPEISLTGEALSDYAATWDGYGEAFLFDQESDRIRITLDENGDGTLEVGDSPTLPPPTDPDVGYPLAGEGASSALATLVPGFLYPIQGATVEERRIRLTVKNGDLLEPWCALQTPIADEVNTGAYNCTPNWGFTRTPEIANAPGCFLTNPQTGAQLPVDCGKLEVCTMGRGCNCDATSCHGGSLAEFQIDASLEEEGAELVGTLLVNYGDRVTVRLTRSE